MDDDVLANFASITDTAPDKAQQYLRLTDGDLQQAIDLYYANDGADLEPQSSRTPAQQTHEPQLPTSTRHVQAAEENDEPIVVGSDSEEGPDGDVQITGSVPTTDRRTRGRPPATRTPAMATPPVGGHDPVVDDEAVARRLQEELYGSTGMGDDIGPDGVRAPIARTTETLVGPGSFGPNDDDDMQAAVMEQLRARQSRPRDRPGIFNQRAPDSIWNDGDPSAINRPSRSGRTAGGSSQSSSRQTMLAEMYRPPFEIMSRLPWEQIRQEGKQEQKWLLVNIQDPSIFDCQVLNRDIWKDPGIKETVKENFIFMQYGKDDPRGQTYIQYYFQGRDNADAYPHIAVVDPRTGEQVKVWSGLPAPKAPDFLMQLHEFLDRYSLKASAKNPVAKRKPEAKKETQIEKMTEEQMLEMAMQNSLAPAESTRRDSDPDDLTRSVGNIDSKVGQGDDEDSNMADANITHTNGAPSPFASITSNNPHTEPPADIPSTRIQFRHPSGRVVRRFALSDHVRRIYEWLKANPLEGKGGVEFELICMSKNLIASLDESIEQAGLRNSSVNVEFLEA